jgi:hypothetical protein
MTNDWLNIAVAAGLGGAVIGGIVKIVEIFSRHKAVDAEADVDAVAAAEAALRIWQATARLQEDYIANLHARIAQLETKVQALVDEIHKMRLEE